MTLGTVVGDRLSGKDETQVETFTALVPALDKILVTSVGSPAGQVVTDEDAGEENKKKIRQSYRYRLSTFSPLNFFGKPPSISPIVCARFGYVQCHHLSVPKNVLVARPSCVGRSTLFLAPSSACVQVDGTTSNFPSCCDIIAAGPFGLSELWCVVECNVSIAPCSWKGCRSIDGTLRRAIVESTPIGLSIRYGSAPVP